jgi:hypothetical protein
MAAINFFVISLFYKVNSVKYLKCTPIPYEFALVTIWSLISAVKNTGATLRIGSHL